jgi:anti-anti-sigma factor
VVAVSLGLPVPQVPSLNLVGQHLWEILVSAVALLLIGFSQTAGDARAFATRHRYRIDVNQESVAQGMANLGAGVFQGMPVSTSLSASSLNESAGARTPVASLTTGALVVATLLLLAPVFSELPKAVLAAIIIDAVVFGMIDVAELRRLRRVKRIDFWIAIAATLGVLSAGVLLGVVIGIVLSLVWLVRVATQPAMPLLGREGGTQVFRDLEEHPDAQTEPGIAVLRIDGGLFFATAEAVDERVRAVTEGHPGLRTLVLDLGGVNFADSQGAAKLTEISELTDRDGITLRLACVKRDVLDVFRAEGFPRQGRPRPGARQRAPGRQGPRHRCSGAPRSPVRRLKLGSNALTDEATGGIRLDRRRQRGGQAPSNVGAYATRGG